MGGAERNSLISQIIQFVRFGIVGGSATLVHAAVYAGLLEALHMNPMGANFLAFLAAFSVSFFGHLKWTFIDRMKWASRAQIVNSMIRFLVVALIGLGTNFFFVFLCTSVLILDPIWAILPMIFVTPVLTFFLARWFAFN